MISVRIKRARLAAGLSLREAGARAGLSAMAISKFETGAANPTSDSLIRLARALDTRLEFFFRPVPVQLQRPQYRKHASLSGKRLARIEADIMDQVERFCELVALFPNSPVPSFVVPVTVPDRIDRYEDIEQVALDLRYAWDLGLDAIPSLADMLEERGVLVLTTPVSAIDGFDGLTATVSGFPVVVVGDSWPGDRQRFTLAHELGHLVLAGRLHASLDEEKVCDRFAGAFLVPAPVVRQQLGKHRSRMEPLELYHLKHEYGVSMSAWILRAFEIEVITESTRSQMLRQFASNGWRKSEPGEQVPSEKPKLFERLVLRALAEEMIGLSKAAELAGVSIAKFREQLRFKGASDTAD